MLSQSPPAYSSSTPTSPVPSSSPNDARNGKPSAVPTRSDVAAPARVENCKLVIAAVARLKAMIGLESFGGASPVPHPVRSKRDTVPSRAPTATRPFGGSYASAYSGLFPATRVPIVRVAAGWSSQTTDALPFVCATSAMWLGGRPVEGFGGEVAGSDSDSEWRRRDEGVGPRTKALMGWVKRRVERVVEVATVQKRTEPSREAEATVRPTPMIWSAVTAFVWPVSVRGFEPSWREGSSVLA